MAVGTSSDGAIYIAGEFRPPERRRHARGAREGHGEPLAHVGVATWTTSTPPSPPRRPPSPAGPPRPTTSAPACCAAAAAALQARADEIADLIVRETGSIPGKAQYEVGGAANELHEAAALTSARRRRDPPLAQPRAASASPSVSRSASSARSRRGTSRSSSACASPRPRLALGNAVVLKPSPETPLSGGLIIAELLAEAGLPAGVFNVVTGDQEIGERLVDHAGT